MWPAVFTHRRQSDSLARSRFEVIPIEISDNLRWQFLELYWFLIHHFVLWHCSAAILLWRCFICCQLSDSLDRRFMTSAIMCYTLYLSQAFFRSSLYLALRVTSDTPAATGR